MYVPSLGAVNFPELELYPCPLLVITWGNTKMSPLQESLDDVILAVKATGVSFTEIEIMRVLV